VGRLKRGFEMIETRWDAIPNHVPRRTHVFFLIIARASFVTAAFDYCWFHFCSG